MSFTIPEGLAPELYPLAWLVGTWRGEGIVEYPGIDASGFTQTVVFDHDGGPYLRYESTIHLTPGRAPQVPDPLNPQSAVTDDSGTDADGENAATQLQDSDVFWSTETGYWRIAPEPHQGVPEGQISLEVLLADPAGRVSVYLGASGDGKVQLVSDLIARTGTAPEVSASQRMYGNVNGQLMWVHSLAAFGHPLQTYASATLTRQEQ